MIAWISHVVMVIQILVSFTKIKRYTKQVTALCKKLAGAGTLAEREIMCNRMGEIKHRM